jgi:hypothetical protein
MSTLPHIIISCGVLSNALLQPIRSLEAGGWPWASVLIKPAGDSSEYPGLTMGEDGVGKVVWV